MKKGLAIALLGCLLLICGLSGAMAEQVTIAGAAYDKNVSRLDLTHVKIEDVQALEAALCDMPNLTEVDLSYCGLKNQTLADLRERMAERGVKVVWTLKFDSYTLRTDATAFSTLHSSKDKRLGEDTLGVLQYATELKAVDLGHNWIFDISFLQPLKDLRVVILSDNRISDLSPLDGKPLEYLEAFNNRLSDISFLADCDTLIDINLCLTHVSDLSPLYRLPHLKRVYISSKTGDLTKAEIEDFLSYRQDNLEAYNFYSQYPTSYGWREDDRGVGHPRYEIIKAMFKEGVYYDFDTVLRPDQYVHLFD